MDENEFRKFDKWITLHVLLHDLKKDLKVTKERLASTEDGRKKLLYDVSIKRIERDIAGVKKWMEEYE
ncbi:hypothetical protein ACTHP3_21690 [Shouchella rhizosphaerae]|uniref:hypothetical protein n=1 Tax=Shouchella rhizosphaerae TaxID=866786 RepID=UPI003F8060D0